MRLFETILIANRGEIARRVIRTARRLGIRTVAVHSDADTSMPFVREADVAVCIGAAPARDSYLRQDRILDVARKTGAQAIHPGYGFLSENAEFAEAVEAAGLVWIGPTPSSIRAMGLKDAAKKLMMAANVPVAPGYMGDDQDQGSLAVEAAAIGYPVLIKAVAGGGGKGMRKVESAAEFADALASCRRESAAAFGDDRVLIEKYINAPRHIEVQIFGDRHGNIVHLFERDCSLQRRHQKVIEEAPAPGMDEATRAAVCGAAIKAAKAVDYVGAGTVEFIGEAFDGLRADRIWFLEMNTRLQVEHPVTEAITGQDLVEWQIRVAAGEPLPKAQTELVIDGWAMEARLYAENSATGFLPSTGRLEHLRLPCGIRIDSGVEEGDEITPFYDPMIAKLIVHADTRAAAATKLARAASAVEVWPVRTNAAVLVRTAGHPDFVGGQVDTGFIERHSAALVPSATPSAAVLQIAAHTIVPSATGDPWTVLAGYRVNAPVARQIEVEVAGRPYLVDLDDAPTASRTVETTDGRVLFLDGEAWAFGPRRTDPIVGGAPASDGAILAPMPGRIVTVSVVEGASITRGQRLVVLEAMKMEHALRAPFDGVVAALSATVGAQVSEGTMLVRIEKGA